MPDPSPLPCSWIDYIKPTGEDGWPTNVSLAKPGQMLTIQKPDGTMDHILVGDINSEGGRCDCCRPSNQEYVAVVAAHDIIPSLVSALREAREVIGRSRDNYSGRLKTTTSEWERLMCSGLVEDRDNLLATIDAVLAQAGGE